jgi:hypothetical protein
LRPVKRAPAPDHPKRHLCGPAGRARPTAPDDFYRSRGYATRRWTTWTST